MRLTIIIFFFSTFWVFLISIWSHAHKNNIIFFLFADNGEMTFDPALMESREVSTQKKRIKLESNNYPFMFGFHDHHVTQNN